VILLAAAITVDRAPSASACDVCAVYTATEMRESRTGFRIGVGEQFTRFERLQDDGHEIDNPGEYLNSSITQLLLGYDFTSWIGLQLNLPIIARDYRRLESERLVRGNVSGIGDLSLIALVRPFSWVGEDIVVRTALVGGLKFPSGDSDRIGEEVEEDPHEGGEDDGAEEDYHGEHGVSRQAHGGVPQGAMAMGGIHGHDLALGSGSVDGIVGGTAFASWRRAFTSVSLQYAVRTKGSFDYRHANELDWLTGVGVYALLEPEYSLALQMIASGAYKGNDELDGQSLDDSRAAFVFLGPGVTFTWSTSLGADITADLPVSRDNTGVQIVPSYRIRGGMTWHF
jgi:hypothetical protein